APAVAEEGPGAEDAVRDGSKENQRGRGGEEKDATPTEAVGATEGDPPGATRPGAPNPSVPGAHADANISGADTGNSRSGSGSSQPVHVRGPSVTGLPGPQSPSPQRQPPQPGLPTQSRDKGQHELVPGTSAEPAHRVFISYVAV